MPCVSITIKGTSIGTLTDPNGHYTINVPNVKSVLAISFVGMSPQEIEVNGRSVIDITMVSSIYGLEEVVVTALGITREKKSLAY